MRPRQPIVHLSHQSAARILGLAELALPFESGGILVGYRESDDIVVSEVLLVPPESVGSSHYRRDGRVADTLLQEYLQTGSEIEGYVGEWHSHPAPIGPSRLDLRTLKELAAVAEGSVALIVCAFTKDQSHHTFHLRWARRTAGHRISLTTPELRQSYSAPSTPVPDQEIRQ
ncbi:Mov34/MPN/PAD-1 family protein [Arthrobacter sp. FW306-2-2C-D06B]|uniref:Mov34/MPN/PAD-1 family protein n=1 Tax=Arthrobacter sp. FW306-2-2C-D06B TaxID=2879618 RepID=UPI001F3E5447|nr:Mov34/MPN/PAD-1 family protein [Arthrobacter sp. FW306-2-2C-D06B]UKA58240.1 Mov34/MPN/PAD-1 family protein [Arthrobacter sp. FW306-2-2C-D06B]